MNQGAAILSLLCMFLIACGSDGKYQPSAAPLAPVRVEIGIYQSFYGVGEMLRSDTLQPGDSVFLTAGIEPSRSIRMKKYFWKIDSAMGEQVFNFRTHFQTSGRHSVSFHLIDYYGDTLSDTVYLWVSNPPQWRQEFHPSDSSWGVSPLRTSITFHWPVHDPDPDDELHSRFSLFREDSLLLDTVVEGTSLELNRRLEPLTAYRWQVSVQDSYGMSPEDNQQQKTFSTAGIGAEAGIQAPYLCGDHSCRALESVVQCRNTQTATIYSGSPRQADLRYIPAGNYQCWAISPQYADLQTDTITTTLYPGQLRQIPELLFHDTTAPAAISQNGPEPLPGSGDLTFTLIESGPGTLNASVWWNGTPTDQWTLKDMQLTVPTASAPLFSDVNTLTIKLEDASGNMFWNAWKVQKP